MSNSHIKNAWKLPATGVANQAKSKGKKPKDNNAKNSPNDHSNSNTSKNHMDKFKEVQKKHIEAAQKHIEAYESSSEEELEETSLLQSVFKNYGGEKGQLQKTQEFLENVFQSGAAICLICIGTVKRTDYIWSCDSCYSFFHLNCIQRWANDSISLKKMKQELEVGYYNNQGEYIPKQLKAIEWCCPKCRMSHLPSDVPKHYLCFCKKELNPENHPWLVPHSCGEVCRKELKPNCGHRCVLLCHPGPCPPCPQLISVSCECNQSNLKTIRCSQKSWNCGKKCTQTLICGIHICGLPCHSEGCCRQCKETSQQRCICKSKVAEVNCYNRTWRCEKICNKISACGRHWCSMKCHSGPCLQCPETQSCPCGKILKQLPCTEDFPSCGNTCEKKLDCGNHICADRCHKSDCGQCLEIVEKKCRCGLHSKEMPCSKVYTCETKCKRMRDCNKHACNRKCCNNQCGPCDKICGKVLPCGKHKCSSLCHNGPCYPCTLKTSVKCRCGNTSISVLCGREKKTKPPRCSYPCKFTSPCHHPNTHKCHMGECPVCKQTCLLPNDITGCEHPCPAKCHDAVKVQIIDRNFKPAGPWDVPVEKFEIQKLPHPPCEIKVAVDCVGGHENTLWPCWNSKPASCGRACGRALKCGNHSCDGQCHEVTDIKSMLQDITCAECQRECIAPRPDGCIHPCQKRCHPAPCNECNIATKISCHCGLNQVYYKCSEFYRFASEPAQMEELNTLRENRLSCGNRCIKNYACGHRCTSTCHSGKCSNPESCRKKIKIYCECKNRKVEATCDKIRAGFTLTCDDVCAVKQKEVQQAAEAKLNQERLEELERNRLEVEEFEKKFGKKKHKERKRVVVEEKNDKYFVYIGAAVGVIILAIFAYYLCSMQ